MEERPELTYAALAVTLELSRLRSQLLVAAALVDKFPTDEDWWALAAEPEYVESLNSLAEIMNDIRTDALVTEGLTPDSVASAAERHHTRAREAIEIVAERLQVSPDDLLNVLTSA